MINGLQGIPGSGKSFEAVAFHVFSALKEGRLVVTNLPLVVEMFLTVNPSWKYLIELRQRPRPVRGTWDAARVSEDEHGNLVGEAFELFEDGRIEQPESKVRVFGHVWDYFHTWRDRRGRGPLFVIDECHVPLPRLGTDPQVVEYFKLHRHFGADVLLMTQNFRDMNQEIAGLLAILIKCRKADVLGKPDSYIRNVHSGYRGGLVSTETRKYDPAFFKFYRSHTQGGTVLEALATDVKPFLVKFKRATWAVWVLGAVLCVWAFWPGSAKPKAAPAKPAWLVEAERHQGKPLLPADYSAPAAVVPVVAASAPAAVPVVASEPLHPEPFSGKNLHVSGFLRAASGRDVHVFTVSQNGSRIGVVTATELRQVGYHVRVLSECVAVLVWEDRQRAITCDSPSLTMTQQSSASLK